MGKTARYATRKFVCDRRFLEDRVMDTGVQPSPPHENGSKIEDSKSDPPDSEIAANGNEDRKTTPKALLVRETRSRSKTPQKKKKAEDTPKTNKAEEIATNGHEQKTEDKKEKEKKTRSAEKKGNKATADSAENGVAKEDDKKETKKTPKKSSEPAKDNDLLESEAPSKSIEPSKDTVEMDPLVLASDEPDPELQFDENSDKDSGKGSPILARCKTRRSHTRNIPTPKTPRSVTDSESEKNSVAPTPTPENLNDTNDSLNVEDISTRAEAGSDTTRLEYISSNTSVASDSSYLNYSREKSLTDTMRSLSPRRTIRPLNDSYRQRAFRNNLTKADLNTPQSEDSTDRIQGLKRKRSTTPEERKKFKAEGLVSYLSSPINSLKNIPDACYSYVPRLTGYKDSNNDIHGEGIAAFADVPEEEPKKKWNCAIM